MLSPRRYPLDIPLTSLINLVVITPLLVCKATGRPIFRSRDVIQSQRSVAWNVADVVVRLVASRPGASRPRRRARTVGARSMVQIDGEPIDGEPIDRAAMRPSRAFSALSPLAWALAMEPASFGRIVKTVRVSGPLVLARAYPRRAEQSGANATLIAALDKPSGGTAARRREKSARAEKTRAREQKVARRVARSANTVLRGWRKIARSRLHKRSRPRGTRTETERPMLHDLQDASAAGVAPG